jgi:flagellar hook protein FlgE
MDVIANNIANVNTVGFKSQRATFQDAFYQRIQGASGPEPLTQRAGTNPQQIGLGLNLASIDNIMTQGATQRTDRSMDVMLTGPGFLIVQDSGGQFFTRNGNISRDFHNNLHINGMQLMGWSTRFDENAGHYVVDRGALQPLSLAGKSNMPAEPTCLVNLVGNLNVTQLDANDQVLRQMVIFDSLGHRYLVDIQFTYHRDFSEAAASPHGYWTFEFLTEMTTLEGTPPVAVRAVPAFLEGDRENPAFIGICLLPRLSQLVDDITGEPVGGSIEDFADDMLVGGTIAFNTRGELVGMGPATFVPPAPGTTLGTWEPQIFPGAGPNGIDEDVTQGRIFDILIVPIAGVAPAATFGVDSNRRRLGTSHYEAGDTMTEVGFMTLNFEEFFQRGENTSARALTMTGNPPGSLQDISIGPDGTIMGRFSNGRNRVLGQIPLAFFQNPEGLERMGSNLWATTANSGMFDGIGMIGSMQGGALEMSNVDLANEFTEMITTQRGFQAASRTITVSDEMLQELVNLRR